MPKIPAASGSPALAFERTGSLSAVAASLVWLFQAAIIASVLGGLLSNPHDVRIWLSTLAFLALAILRTWLHTLSQRRLSDAADAQIAILRKEVVRREAMAEDGSVLGGAGAISALASEKLEAVRPYLLRYKPARLRVLVLPVCILAISLWYSWAVALVLLLAGPLIPLFMALVGWAAKAASERQMVEIGQLSDLLADRLAALSDLRMIGAGETVVGDFARASEDLRHRTMAVLRIAFLSSTILELFSALGVAMVAVWVGFTLLGELGWGSWGKEISPAIGIYLLLLAPEFFQPLRDLASAWHDRASADAVMDEVQKWREDDRQARLGTGQFVEQFPMPGILRLKGVSANGASYGDIEFKRGERVAITGPSGSGKSTLLRLIGGLIRPDRGCIMLDDQVLDEAVADGWRSGIGWMPQEPHFLNRSLRHNICFGAPFDQKIIKKAHLESVMAGLEKGDQTLLGERGAGLSGGEARRVTLARALHGNPDWFLADEPTADLDAGTAAQIADSLLSFGNTGGSLIVATHDMKLASRMDRIISLAPIKDGTK